MTAKVFHLNSDSSFRRSAICDELGAREIMTALREGHYTHVADVDTDDLETAWTWTNSIVSYWGDDPDVTEVNRPSKDRGHRSSMVGDLIFVRGRLFIVRSIGFSPLNPYLARHLGIEEKEAID